MSILDSALWITLIGMGLVFAVITLLWGLMRALTHVFRDRQPKREMPAVPALAGSPPEDARLSAGRKKAAAAAVAVCLAQAAARTRQEERQQSTGWQAVGASGGPPGAWQTIQRASELSLKSFQRNKKVQR